MVLGVGQLTPQKDFATLIRAVADTDEDCRLLILGEGEQRGELEQLASELDLPDRVSLPGFRSNPYPYFRLAAVYALTSRYEGLPTVMLEAMALGLPIVATDCPTGPHELLSGGTLGHLVPVGDVGAVSRGIDAVLREQVPRREYSGLEQFSPPAVADRYSNYLAGEL